MKFALPALAGASLLALAAATSSYAQTGSSEVIWGPYNADFPAAGDGLTKDVKQGAISGTNVTLSGWVKPSETVKGRAPVAGTASGELALIDGRLAFTSPAGDVTSATVLTPGTWTYVAAVSDGASVTLYADGQAVAHQALVTAAPANKILLAPRGPNEISQHSAFAGRLAWFQITGAALDAAALKALAGSPPQDDLIEFDTGSPTWPVQIKGMPGQVTPQDPWTLPHGKGGYTAPVAKPAYNGPAVVDGVIKAWSLEPAPQVSATGTQISTPGFDTKSWYVATTPGTVLTTLVDRGVYPDPAYGLNNLTIPEKLSKQNYWYRSQFNAPADYKPGRHLFLTFKGINYAAEVWVNGQKLGGIEGAFIRGRFDIAPYVKGSGPIAVAVKVSPAPHPGIPEEESLAAGPGENGGQMAMDGPSFMAAEGWDWIPTIRDRETGLWQDVTLTTTGDVRIGDTHVITALPKADNSLAELTIDVPVTNLSNTPQTVTIAGEITGESAPIHISTTATVAPGDSVVHFPVVSVDHPKLWWPNGYGDPALHGLKLTASVGNAVSDTAATRFGIRQVTYEMSLYDQTGHLDRVEANFTKGHELGVRILDGRHEAIHKLPPAGGEAATWAPSLTPQAQGTAAVTSLPESTLSPYLVIRVNGVRIAARGGSWGMDDFMKRIERSRLEPYFKLQRQAHVNIIRNWVGQNTEDSFYDLADENGLMVLNDFWESTQEYQFEAEDVPLFMKNAKDTVDRYRNHPSIILWFGRNEGVPQPVLNEALENLIYSDDGTRWYTGSSNRINLHDSGPYSYKPIADYFTTFSKGFAVEVGVSSFPTLEAFQATVPAPDQWPISDTWAYHDWHNGGNGTTKPFEAALAAQYGAASSLPDFERKAQMMNYDAHRAIFEGMNAGLWTQNSGRLLWMTQPAWPSSEWQILSHDYDTQASFYGVKSAAEPVHVQMNLPDHRVIAVNNPMTALNGATVTAAIYATDGKLLHKATQAISLGGGAISQPMDLGIGDALAAKKLVIVRLGLTDAAGHELSHNVYWTGADDAAMNGLNALPATAVSAKAANMKSKDGGKSVTVTLTNPSNVPVLETKLTLLDAKGARILPAYYSDNYVSLMPGETRTVTIDYDAGTPASVAVRGWNVKNGSVAVK